MGGFSFTGQPVLNILERIFDIVPGVQKVIGVFYDHLKDGIEAWEVNTRDHSNKSVYMLDTYEPFTKYRNGGKATAWIKNDDLEFHTTRTQYQHEQLEVFDELDHNILLLRYKNEYDHAYDIVFIYFDKSGIGIRSTHTFLSADNRKLIAHILYHAINDLLNTSKNDLDELRAFNKITKNLVNENKNLNDELENTKKKFGLSLVDLCNYHLEEICTSRYTKFRLSHSAIEKIKTYQGEIKNLYSIIQKGVDYVEKLYIDMQSEVYTLEAVHLDFKTEEDSYEEQQDKTSLSERHFKTFLLLNKLEVAAKNVIKKRQDLTGANVGANCSTPISAAAITDALKKHGYRVSLLMNKYPDKWTLIRSGFKPLKNVVESYSDSKMFKINNL